MEYAKLSECDQSVEVLHALHEMLEKAKGFLLLAGKNGTGKTYASKCVYNRAIYPLIPPAHNHDIAYFVKQEELSMVLEEERSKYGQTFSFLKSIRDAQLLVLDDIGTRPPSDSLKGFLYTLVDYRYDLNLATILTTNCTASELRVTMGDAFVSRVASGKCFRLEGVDRRFKDF